MRHAIIAIGCGLATAALGGPALEMRLDEKTERTEIRWEGKPVLVYSFASNQFKPYVKELKSWSGPNALLDAPSDHLHHHGLMYAIRVNDINFWEEQPASGRQKHIRMLGSSADKLNARFTELLHWIGPSSSIASPAPLLVEERSIGVTARPERNVLALEWTSKFVVGDQPVRMHGSAYTGLGLRLAPAWNRVARHSNSRNHPYSAEHKWDVHASEWAAVAHATAGQIQTVALIGHPGNRGETHFFSMNNPFTYLSVTQNLDQAPITYPPGTRFELRYLLFVMDGPRSQEEIQELAQEWLKAKI